MIRRSIACKLVCCVLAVFIVSCLAAVLREGAKAKAAGTLYVSTAQQLIDAMDDHRNFDSIVITKDITIECPTATDGHTSYFTINRNLTIYGGGSSGITITRKAASGADKSALQSIFGIKGNGSYDGITVTLQDITLDGGADFGDTSVYDRINLKASDVGVAGRSIIDVYDKATLTLDDNVTIKNGFCTSSIPAAGGYATANYGGGIRIDCDTDHGGGTVNLKYGACITDCSVRGNTSGYGGGIGGYSFSRINILGGTIKNCSAYYGGGVACTYSGRHTTADAGVFNVHGGSFINCHANSGGAISADGDKTVNNCLLGGKIENCEAVNRGGAVCLGGNNDGIPALTLSQNKTGGPLTVSGCKDHEHNASTATYNGNKLGYDNMYLGAANSPITIISNFKTVSFKKYKDDSAYVLVLSFKSGSLIGTAIPRVSDDNYRFVQWNTSYDGSGTVVNKDTKVTKSITAYARWLMDPVYETPSSVEFKYGDTDKTVAILNASSPYGGTIKYQWYEGTNRYGEFKLIEGATSSVCTVPLLPVGYQYLTCKVTVDMGDYFQKSSYAEIWTYVAKRPVKVKWSDTELTYNGKAQLPKAELQDILPGEDVSIELSGAKTDVGTYVASVNLVGNDASNYEFAWGYSSTVFTINPAPKVTVTPIPSVTKTPTAKPTPKVTAAPTKKPTVTPSKASQVSLNLDKSSLSVVCGKTASLKATLKGSNSKISWKSSDANVASVDANGKITAKMAGEATITATAAGKSAKCKVTVLYKDVTNPKDFWYVPTNYLTAKGVVKGYDKQTLFKPANKCTRAQMVTFIWRLQGEPSPKATTCKFKDVKEKDYFYKACIWGNENGIVEGYKDGTFGPKIVCARKHAVTFLWRLAKKPSPKSTVNKFTDVKKSDYFYTATLWASEKGILAGYDDNTFRPNGNCLRRQMVTFLYKYDMFVNSNGGKS